MLASITSERENSFIGELARERNEAFDFAFLGGFGKSNNGNKWRWMDGLLVFFQIKPLFRSTLGVPKLGPGDALRKAGFSRPSNE